MIFLTDHGGDPVYGGSNEPLRGVKATLFEGGIRVPCLMRWPGKIQPGSTSEVVGWAIDFFPTFCALAGVDLNGFQVDGEDISKTLMAGATNGERELFWELGAHEELSRKPWGALRKGNWKYVNSPKEGAFLFDLATDPNEENNLSAKEIERFEAMQERWEDLQDEYRK